MSREQQIRSFLESAAPWCGERGHTLLMGDEACYVCGEEFSRRTLQVRATAPPEGFHEQDIRFVAAGERFETPEGTMQASNGVCRCGRRGAQHLKFWPWASHERSVLGDPACPGFVATMGEAPGSTRIPGAVANVRREGSKIVHVEADRCICGHRSVSHEHGHGGCKRCSCRQLTVR